MRVTAELFQLKDFLADVIAIADAARDRRECPRLDRLTQRQAYDRFGEAQVKQLLDAGLIGRERLGTKKNSPTYYSYAEILTAVAARKAQRKSILKL